LQKAAVLAASSAIPSLKLPYVRTSASKYRPHSFEPKTHPLSCRFCQRETGASYALNATIEIENIKLADSVQPEFIQIPTKSGRGQWWVRCPECRIATFSIYGGREKPFWVLRVGTLDNPDLLTPTAHIYTSTKQPWIKLADGIPAFEEGYDPRTVWSQEMLERFKVCTGRIPTSW
jgi:hypothetical protein